jgi:hypothetical protein
VLHDLREDGVVQAHGRIGPDLLPAVSEGESSCLRSSVPSTACLGVCDWWHPDPDSPGFTFQSVSLEIFSNTPEK